MPEKKPLIAVPIGDPAGGSSEKSTILKGNNYEREILLL